MLLFSLLLNGAQAQTCPGSDEVQAVLSMKYKADKRLFVCGFQDPIQTAPKGKKHLSNFTVYYETDVQVKKIFTVTATEPFWVSVDKKNKMIFEEIAWVADKYVPLFTSNVSCTEDECKRSESVCSVPSGKVRKEDILRQIDKKIRGKFTTLHQPISMMIEMALGQVLAGDLHSRRLFESDEIMEKVDVPAGQQFLVSKKIYNRVKTAGCFKAVKKR